MASRVPATAGTLSSKVYERLRLDIIHAVLPPGQKLHIAQLCTRYAVGLSPMREALNRLARDGLVTHSEQRGFHVTPVSEVHLDELTKTRGWLNELALRQSIANGDRAWEEQVVLAYHRLSRLPRAEPGTAASDINAPWEEAHRDFHKSLLMACGSSWLLGYCEQLFDAADRYRHLSRLSNVREAVRARDEHKALMEATVERKTEDAVLLLHKHLAVTAELVRGSLAGAPPPAAPRRRERRADSTQRAARRSGG
ncbi:GntR family transcriptional regulator [Variovorax sp. PBL-H6]|uniref:GntR family transcriptional regulator n=1 Tax=Variovorax sp. PBL-H6 TaxID=434009 RepID=UPI0013A55834|nr:GntR family transcriptional regulator [Variovorax sp. PBL-H6]